MGSLVEVVLVLAVLLILQILCFGATIEIRLWEIVLWGGGAFIIGFLFFRWLTEGLIPGGRGAKTRSRGPAAEGLALFRKGDLDGAEAALRGCLQKHPANADAARGLAEIVLRRGDAQQYAQIVTQLLTRPDALERSERVVLCHRLADVCIEKLGDPERAAEALARIELDYPDTTDAQRARQRIERIVGTSDNERKDV